MNETLIQQNTNTNVQSNGKASKFVIFKLGEESYGLDILSVKEIINYKDVTPLPNLPRYVKGVINLRGMVIPIIDLRLRLKMDEVEYTKFTVIIVIELHNRTIGIVVDNVASVEEMKGDDIQDSPEVGMDLNTDLIYGIGRKKDNMIIILDLEKVFSQAEAKLIQSKTSGDEEIPQEN